MKVSISLAQMHLEFGQPLKNFERASQMIAQAAHEHASCILFPELWTSAYDFENRFIHAQSNLTILEKLNELARLHQIAIGGSFLEAQPGDFLYNTHTWLLPSSTDQVKYRKIHLFRLMDEDKWLQSGNEPICNNFQWGKAGLAICYDLRFPEIFRNYALQGADLTFIPAEWPAIRIYHWKTLLRARAIENQMFVIGVNCVGKIGNETFGGSSAIISPWGEVIAEASSTDEQLITAEIDLDQVDEIRRKIPVFEDRRPDIYGEY
ncbi:MAG: carbon-nitrogen family hydrolase [Anaerolineaceae bacterium]|nr:carbon-nitrogen family hydrolase [Anaerolineaceae bacterium]